MLSKVAISSNILFLTLHNNFFRFLHYRLILTKLNLISSSKAKRKREECGNFAKLGVLRPTHQPILLTRLALRFSVMSLLPFPKHHYALWCRANVLEILID